MSKQPYKEFVPCVRHSWKGGPYGYCPNCQQENIQAIAMKSPQSFHDVQLLRIANALEKLAGIKNND